MISSGVSFHKLSLALKARAVQYAIEYNPQSVEPFCEAMLIVLAIIDL